MLREDLQNTLKAALKEQDKCTLATVRLILAALKDRDIAARGNGQDEGVGDDEIQALLQTMVKQRRDAIELFKRGGRDELADREAEEIGVIEKFQPRQLNDGEIDRAVKAAIADTQASKLKDMGRVMTALRECHAGEMNFGKASDVAKKLLGVA